MKTLYLDIFSGISGDMFIGALLDLGVSTATLEAELAKLGLTGYHLHAGRAAKSSIEGVKFTVHLEHSHEHRHEDGTVHSHPHTHEPEASGQQHSAAFGPHGGPLVRTSKGSVELSVFETNVPPRFRLYFYDREGKPAKPLGANDVLLKTERDSGRRQTFKFKAAKNYLEATSDLPEPHEFDAVLQFKRGKQSESHEVRFVEEGHHHHDHHNDDGHAHGPHAHTHSHEDTSRTHAHAPEHSHEHTHEHARNYRQIRQLISQSRLSGWVKEKANAIFHRIAVAEGKIHGLPPEQVHFHEVGAVDSIVDIVGACVGLELLDRPRVLSGPVVEGTGWINCAHGRFPIPAPATLEILGARGVAISQCDEPQELVTPTGAALLAELVEEFGPMREIVAEKIGFGLGTRDNLTRPNVLRAILGHTKSAEQGETAHDWETDTIAVVETNLDDINSEILGNFVERAFEAGALDVFHTPIQMKKNRPGVLLTVLCAEADADKFAELLLTETTAFGVRRSITERRKLRREFRTVKTPFGEVILKLGSLNGRIVQTSPEYESCRKAARKAAVPLRKVYDAAKQAFDHSSDRNR